MVPPIDPPPPAGKLAVVRGGERRPLTERQASILGWVSAYIEEHGFAPSLREIGRAFNIRSTNGVNDHLNALVRKGYLTRDTGGAKSRAMVVIDGPRAGFRAPASREIVEALTGEVIALRNLLVRVYGAGLRQQRVNSAEMTLALADIRDVLTTEIPR